MTASTTLIGSAPDQVPTNGQLGKLAHLDSDAPFAAPIKALQAAPTIASATTIAPAATISFVSGTTTIQTITPPHNILKTGGQLTVIPTGAWATNTAGNIALATTAVVNKMLVLSWDAATAKWYPSY